MKQCIILLGVLFFVFAITGESLAVIGVGPRVGYYEAQDADAGRYFVGAVARFNLFGIGAEAAIDYRSEKYDDGKLTVQSWPVTLSVLYYPLPIVYGVAGVGWYHTTAKYDEEKLGFKIKDQTSTEMGYHVGVGVQLPIGMSSKIAADVRYVFLNYDLENTADMGKQDADFYAVTISLLWGLF
ncbi:outer membrane beta-barrel protein [candidate division KSB1 bacterium]|nr:outer membrane beta-barrel protein [candidate division KSB1 bacterium]